MINKWWKYGLWVLVAAAFFAAAHAAFWQRYMVERDFNQVQLAVHYDEFAPLSGFKGLSAREGLERFKEQKVSGVVLRETILDDLRITGDIQVFTGQELINRRDSLAAFHWLRDFDFNIDANRTYLLMFDEATYKQLYFYMNAKMAGISGHQLGDQAYIIETAAPYLGIKELGVGFSRAAVADVQAAAMDVILQVRTWPGATQQSIITVFRSFSGIPNVSAIVFNDDTLPGFTQLLPVLGEEIRQLGLPITQVEFFPQRGLTKLGIIMDKKVVRLHTIAPNEMKRLSPGEALDRYTLAAAERNHRILLVRPLMIGGDLFEQNMNFLEQLVQRLEGEGLVVAQAGKLPPIPISRGLNFLIGLGVIAGGLLLLHKILAVRYLPLVGLLSAAAWVGLLFLEPVMGRKLMALAAVIVFPTLSLIYGVTREGRTPLGAVRDFVLISLFSLLGALFAVGLLADASFMLKLDQFVGVKLAHVIPLVILLLYFPLLLAKGQGLEEKARTLLEHPLKVGLALAAGAMAIAVAVYVLRTGNEGMAVSGLELQFRSMLDQFLGVRPRTKEFLLGHPALLLLLLYGYRDNRFLPLLLLGAIGQASLVNTFAHVHTPLVISLLRAFNGIWIGILLGLAVYFGIKLLARLKGRF